MAIRASEHAVVECNILAFCIKQVILLIGKDCSSGTQNEEFYQFIKDCCHYSKKKKINLCFNIRPFSCFCLPELFSMNMI